MDDEELRDTTRENEETLMNQIQELLGELDEEAVEKDLNLLSRLNDLLTYKVGVDREQFLKLKEEHVRNQCTYKNLFDAIEEELINKADMKMMI